MEIAVSSPKCVKLRDWFIENGGYIHPDAEIVEDAENGIHFRARRSLPASSGKDVAICTCPIFLSFSHLNFAPREQRQGLPPVHDDSASTVSQLLGTLPLNSAAYFFLAEQRLLGKQSFWEPYISCLPKEDKLSTPLFFSQQDLDWLRGTNLYAAVDQRRAMWEQEWKTGCDVLRSRGFDVDKFTWELYLWAATIFSSRSFTSAVTLLGSVETFPLLYPVLDLLNHRFGAKVIWDFTGGSFSLRITEPVREGEQIYNNYAPKGNEELLMGYGFCFANNLCDEVAIRMGRPPNPVHQRLKMKYPTHFVSVDWNPSEATSYLRGRKHYSGGYESDVPCFRGIPPTMVGVITELVQFIYEQQAETDEPLDPLELTAATIEQLLAPLHAKMDAVDANEPPGEPQNRRQEYAKIYRGGQREILRDIIDELEAYLESTEP